MGSQPPQQPQGLAPGETAPEEESRLEAFRFVALIVAAVIVGTIAAVYFGGWLAHVLSDIARSGWASK